VIAIHATGPEAPAKPHGRPGLTKMWNTSGLHGRPCA